LECNTVGGVKMMDKSSVKQQLKNKRKRLLEPKKDNNERHE